MAARPIIDKVIFFLGKSAKGKVDVCLKKTWDPLSGGENQSRL